MRYTKITPIQLKRKNSLIFYSSVYFHALSGIGGLKLEKLTIGKLIEYQMNKKGIDMEKLVEGLCSITSLKRLIQGGTIQSFFLMERIIERLGLSVNKISLLHNEKEDELFIRRGIIGKLLTKGDYDRAEKLLSNYKEAADLSNTLQLQYVYEVEGIIATKRDGKAKEALQLFCKALDCTVNMFAVKNIHRFLLGEEEMILVLLILRETIRVKNEDINRYGESLLSYVDKHFEDEEVKVNVYSKLAWVLGESFIQNQMHKEALELTLQGVEYLTANGLLLHLPQFLDRVLSLTLKTDKDMHSSWKKKRDALKELYEEYNEPWETEDIRLWESYRQNGIYLISELLKDERNLAGYSQEELAENIGIDVKTISRIESGKSKPKKGTLQSIKEHFNIERDIFQTRLAADSFFLLEMERDISRFSSQHRNEEAETLFKVLKKQLSLEYKINRQYIRFMEALFDYVFKRKDTEKILKKLEKAFCITRTKRHLENIGEFVTTNLEARIVNLMAICYEKLGDRKENIHLLERAVKGYEKSKTVLKYHRIPLGLLYTNLCISYEESDRFEDALKLADKVIGYYLQYKRGDKLGILVAQKIYTLNRKTDDRTTGKAKYQQAYRLMELMQAGERTKVQIKKLYKDWYGEELYVN